MTPFWNSASRAQLSAIVANEPKLKGGWPVSSVEDLVGASSSHTIGRPKTTAKNRMTTVTSDRPRKRAGVTARLVAFKESSSEDEEGGETGRDDEQEQRDGGRAVEVVLAEGVEVGTWFRE